MPFDPHGARDIPPGIRVIGNNGVELGRVREAYPHYVLVDRDDEHESLEIPVHAIVGLEDGALRVSVNRESVSAVDEVETAHRQVEGH